MLKKPEYKIYLDKMVGKGSFATVYLCRKVGDESAKYVVKIIQITVSNDYIIDHEIESNEELMKYRHPNIIHIDYVDQSLAHELHIYSKYYSKGTLEDYIRKRAFLKPKSVHRIYKGILNGLDFLHEKGLVHRDMKHENVFLDKDENGLHPVIGDLGFLREKQTIMDTSIGTPITMSPELLKRLPYNISVDIWALGAMLYKMIFGMYPLEYEAGKLTYLIEKGDYYIYENVLLNRNALEVIMKCLSYDKNIRPTSKQLIEDKYYKNDWDKQQLLITKKRIKLTFHGTIEERLKKLDWYLNNDEYSLIINP